MNTRHLRILICLLIITGASSARAEWDWYAGDLAEYGPRQLPVRFQEAIDLGLRWRVLYGRPEEGFFTGLSAFLREEEFSDPRRFTPLLGSVWQSDSLSVICLGVDPRAPVPQDEGLTTWAEAHNGLLIFDGLPPTNWTIDRANLTPQVFLGLGPTGWHPACLPGGQWDSLLTLGYRVFLASAGSSPGAAPSKTHIWAESTQPHHIINALRQGASYVAEADGLRLDFRLEDRNLGDTVEADDDAWVRLRAAANHPISRVALIADGEIIWSTEPDATRWETQIRLSLFDKHYVRAMAESKTGGYRTLTNPIFLASDFHIDMASGPSSPIERLVPLHLSLDSAIESLSALHEDAQIRVLSEYLRSLHTRYATVMVLENREDLIPDVFLDRLTQSADPAVRLGALFAQVARNVPDLTDLLFEHLHDPDSEVRRYAARMLSQFSQQANNARLFDEIQNAEPAVQAYLIRALDPASASPQLVRHLIHATRQREFGVASAATDALIAFGNRDFRTIRALRDSAQMGHVLAVRILGDIGDHRVVGDIEKIYRKAKVGALRRAAFLALQQFGKGYYPDRPSIYGAAVSHTPILDGVMVPGEWINAASIAEFAQDSDGDSLRTDITAWTTRDSTHLLLAFALPLPDSSAHPMVEWAISPSPALSVPFVFTIALPTDSLLIPDPALQTAHAVRENTWTAECAVLLSELGVDPQETMRYLRMNITLIDNNRRWAWTPTFGAPGNPDRFGDLHLNSAPE